MIGLLRSSLWAKILAVVLISTFVALVVSTVALLFYEINTYRAFLINDLQTQAEILSRATAPALQFDDPESARANLNLLQSRPSYETAAVYGPNGEIVATYQRDAQARESWPAARDLGGTQIEDGTLTLFHPVIENGNRLGSIYLRASYDLGARVWTYLVILITVMALALLAAVLMSLAVMGRVMGPVQSVTRIARRVIDERDFSHRAVRASQDEIGVLVDAFNAMLNEVESRTTKLETANRTLRHESETRRRAEAELREVDRRKDEFLATLAHELRNPMAPMRNAISLLQTPEIDPATSRQGLGILDRQLAQLVRLVDDLLDVARISSGKLTVRKEVVALGEIVRAAIETIEPQLESRCQDLTVDLPEEAVFLQADPARLAQVLGNLLNNAIKFSQADSGIALSALADTETVRIQVSDQGIGISAEVLGRVFDMFSQGDPVARQAETGLGVGLALARQLIRLHGGTIDAASGGPGQGALFTITIPRADAPTGELPAGKPAGPDPIHRERMLIVDDNVDFAGSLAQLFGSIGHDVHVANSGEAALKMAREIAPDVAILDIGLPDMSGHELAGLVRSAVDKPSLVLIAISGWGQETDRQRSLQAGFDLHLVKPVDFRKIQDSIRELRSGAGT